MLGSGTTLAVARALGHRASVLAVHGEVRRLIGGLRRQRPDLVFNLMEMFGDDFGAEVGVSGLLDLLKVPYTGDPRSYGQIAAGCPVPLVAAGGPKADTLQGALTLMAGVVASGARGATIGRNIWGFPQVTAAVRAFRAVIHDGASAEAAMKSAGLA